MRLVPQGVQARLVHAEDIVQSAVGDPLFALEQRHNRQEHSVELALSLGLLAVAGLRGGEIFGPDDDPTLLIYRHTLAVDELVFERFQVCRIELELELTS